MADGWLRPRQGGTSGGGGPSGFVETIDRVTGDALLLGHVLAFNSAGQLKLASSLTAGGLDAAEALSTAAYLAGTTATVNVLHGRLYPVRFSAAVPAVNNGSEVFLSETSGLATLIPPTTSGRSVVLIGTLVGANGVTAAPDVQFQPVFRGRII